MDTVTATIAKAYPRAKGRGSHPSNLSRTTASPKRRESILWFLLGGVCFVLLIACANVANLLLAQSMTRQKELAGPRRRRRDPQERSSPSNSSKAWFSPVAEGSRGQAVGYAILQALIAFMPPNTLPGDADLRLNTPVLLFALGITTLAGLLFGCAPAWYASRVDPGESLKEGGRLGIGQDRRRLRRVLVVGEFALALALLAGAGLAIHSFWNLEHVDLGVRTDHILTFGLPVPDARPKDPQKIVAYYRSILESIQTVPGVTHAATMTELPLQWGWDLQFTVAGSPGAVDLTHGPSTGVRTVTPDYFQTFGIRLVEAASSPSTTMPQVKRSPW